MVCVLVGAVLFPKMATVVMDMMPSFQTVVICAGDQLIVVRLGPDGTPVEVTEDDMAPCVFGDALTIAAMPEPLWVGLARDYVHVFTIQLNPTANRPHARDHIPPRAPPVVI